MRALAEEEHASLTEALSNMVETTFPRLLIPASSTAQMSALVELRSGVGGSESSLFLGEVMRMYLRVAGTYGWNTSVLSRNETENGGIKDAILEIKGEGAYDLLRWESGVHRVQRIPATEANGRVHTSTITVMVGLYFSFWKGINAYCAGATYVRRLGAGLREGRGALLDERCQGGSHACEGSWWPGKISDMYYRCGNVLTDCSARQQNRVCCPSDA